MPLKISINKSAPQPPQATVALQASKTLDGNILISDHAKMNIVIVPSTKKIITIPKPFAEQNVYDYQRDLMDSLFRGGVIKYDSIQGGSSYGMLEGVMGEDPELDSVQVALLEIEKFIKTTSADEAYAEEYDKNIEDRFTIPTDKDSTEWGEIPPEQDDPNHPTAQSTYQYAGYGYLY